MFEQASKMKLRFTTPKGLINVEDIWDLPLESLDDLAKGLNRSIKESDEESFIVKKTKANNRLNLQFEIVKYIIKDKLEAIEALENRLANKARKEKIMNIISEKEDNSLKNKSVAALKKMLDE